MREIDEKVVEMRFKNSDFEKHAKETINTLDTIEKKTSFPNAKKNFQNLQKEFLKISFTPLVKSIDAVTVKFSALQVAGITALQRITNQAIDTGERLVKSLSIDQVTAGFTKYEQKTTSVQTIMSATGKSVEEVNSALEKLNWFTDETSYNFTDMVDNIGKFTSAGVDLDDAMSAMIGIANEAAISGQNAASASRAMYNFAQAIGTGAVKLMDWKSIENANMATQEFKQTIIDTALNMGTLTKEADGMYKVVGSKDKLVSVTNFNENLSEGWFTSDVLVESLKQYSDYAEEIYELQQEMGLDSAAEAMAIYSNEIETLGERAFKAGQVSKTLTDAIDATKDAVSTQWMKTFELIVGNLEQASDLWTEFTSYLWDFFASDLVSMNDILQETLATDNYRTIINELEEAGVAEDEFGKVVKETAKKYGIAIDSIIEREGSLEAAVKKYGWSSIISESLDEIAGGAQVTSTKVVDVTDKIEEYQNIVNRVIRGDFQNGVEARTKALAEAGYEFSVIQPLVNKQLEKGSLTAEDFQEVLGNLTEEELKNIGITKEQAESLKELSTGLTKKTGRELLIDSFRNALKGIEKVIQTVKEAWNEIFPPKTAEEIYAIIEKFHEFSKGLILDSDGADKLKRSLKGVFAAVDIVRQVIASLLRGGIKILGTLFGKTGLDVAELSASLGDNIVAFRDWLNEGNKISVFIDAFVNSLLNAKETVSGWMNSFFKAHPNVSKWFDGLSKSFDDFRKAVKDKWSMIFEDIKNGDWKGALDTVASYFKEFRDTVMSYITGIDFSSFVDNTTETGFGRAKTITEDLKATFLGFFEAIKNGATLISGWVSSIIKSINPMIIVPIIFIGTLATLNSMAKELGKIVDLMTCFIEPLADIKDSIVKAFTALKTGITKVANAKAFEERAKGIQHLAVAFAILAGSCWLLAQVPWPSLVIAAGVLIALGGTLVIFNNSLKQQGKGLARLNQFATGLGIAIVLLAASLKILETIKPEKAFQTVLSFIAMVGVLSLAIVGMTFIKELPEIKGTLIVLAVVIGMVSTSFLMLNFVQTDGLIRKVLSIGLVLGELLIVIAILTKMQQKWGDTAKAWSVIGIVLALDVLVLSLKLIETVKVRDIIEHLGSFMAVFVMLNILAKTAGKVQGGSGGWQILALATGLLILVPAIKSLSKLAGGDLAKAVVAVGTILAIEALIVAASKKAGEHAVKAGAMILMISGAVAAMALVIWGFSALEPAKLAQGVAAVDSLLLVISLLVYVSKEAEANIKNIAIISVLAMVIGVCVVMLGAFDLDTEQALQASGAISLLLLSMGLTVKILNGLEPLKKGVTPNLFALSGVTAVLAVIMTVFAEIDPENAIGQAAAMSLLLVALAGTIVILQKFGDAETNITKMLPTIIMLTVVMFAMAALLSLIADIDAEKAIGQVGALSACMGALLAATTILALISKIPYIDKIEKGMLAVGKVLGIVSLVLLVIGGLESTIHQIFGDDAVSLTTLLEEATLVMTAMGNAIGSLIGGLLGGIVGTAGESFASHLPIMGTFLSQFADNLKPFLEIMGADKITNSKIGENMSLITQSILNLTSADFLTSMTSFLDLFNPAKWVENAQTAALGEEITPFDGLVKGLVKYAEGIDEVADIFAEIERRNAMDDLEKGVDIGEQLSALLTSVPSRSDFGDFFKGEISFTNLSEGLVEYGKAVNAYALQAIALAGGSRISAIMQSIPVATVLNTLLQKLPTDGGLVADIFGGEVSWKYLSDGLPQLGDALAKYGASVESVTTEQWKAIKTSVKPAGKLNDLLKELEGTDGWIDKVFGSDTGSWSTLSTGLEGLGTALVTLGTTMYKFEQDAGWGSAERAIPMLKSFVDSAQNLLNMSGLGTINDTIDAAAIKLGSGLGAFGDYFEESDSKNIREGIRLSKQMVAIASAIKEKGIAGGRYLIRVGEDISGWATEMKNASNTLRSITNEDFYAIAKYTLLGYTNGIQNNLDDVENVMDEFVNVVSDTARDGLGVHSPGEEGYAWGQGTNWGFMDALKDGYSAIKTSVTGWVNNIKEAVDLDSITAMFSDFGFDISSVIPDLSSLGLNLGEDMSFDFEKMIGDKKAEIKALTDEFGQYSDQVINAQIELDTLKDEYKDYQKTRSENLEYYENKEYEAAQKEFDKLLQDYKDGRKSQMEFDTEYTALLAKNTSKQAELFQYSAGQIQEYVTDSLGVVQQQFEDKISNIQSSMDSMQDNLNKGFDEQFKYTTNQDLFDEEISKYDDSINELNKQIERERNLHGEDSIVVQKLQKDLERLQQTRDDLNEQWEAQDEDYKNKIVSVDQTGEWEKQAQQAKETLAIVDSVKDKLSDEMLAYMGTLDPQTLHAFAQHISTMTDSEIEAMNNAYLDMINSNKTLVEELHSPKILEAEEKFVYDFNETLNKLPDTAKVVAAQVVKEMANTFSEETNATLATFKESGDVLLFAIKEGLGLVEGPSKSKKLEDTGKDTATGISNGFAMKKDDMALVFANTLNGSLFTAATAVDYSGLADKIVNGIWGALSSEDSSFSISPVVTDTSAIQTDRRRNLKSGRSVTIAQETGATFNSRFDKNDNDTTDSTGDIARAAMSFVQNIYSPKALNRTEIRRDTKQFLQLANSKFK